MGIQFTQPQSDFWYLKCKYPAFVGGYGSGKTMVMIAKAFYDKFKYPTSVIAMYEPTYDLARLILIPRMLELLNKANVRFHHNKSENIIYVKGRGMFIVRTLDNPSRIIGYEAFRSHVDEIDTLKEKQAEDVFIKVLARTRQKITDITTGKQAINRLSFYSTPEGFRFLYKNWERNPDEDHMYVRAPTYTNPNLPEDYVSSLRKQYDDQLVDAYVEGLFCNLTTGTVYRKFNRKLNNSDVVLKDREPLYIGMDFNVGRGCAVVHVLRNNLPIAVDEVVGTFDTTDTVRVLKERYDGWPIMVYPDASSKNRKSQNASHTDLDIIKAAGWRVKKINRNPSIKDRINSMNGMFCNAEGERRYKVNVDKCPFYADALEQQTYDKNGLPEKGEGKGDDETDAGGYFIADKFPIIRKRIVESGLSGI